MGYYTLYKLDYDAELETSNKIHEFMKDNQDQYYGVLGEDSYKWYDHEEEMKTLSIEFPGILFRLDGEGEDQGDVWVKYFKNGKIQSCYTETFLDDTFDENKLT